VTAKRLRDFINTLDIPESDREALLEMTPASYTGLAAELARGV
jgi:adenylosuccinate lyase